ncbi:MAG: hypothetical protein ACXWQ5_06955 [Ktedonobacterales bacterium]
MGPMEAPAKRYALLAVACALIAVVFVACAAPATAVTPNTDTGGGNGVNVFRTPSAPTPPTPFPEFTIGAWPSNYSPNNNDNITIYVLCKIQDPQMQKMPQPAANVTVTVSPDGMNSVPGQTDNSGLAAVPLTINDPNSGVPVTVTVSATYKGKLYTNYTFFTPSPTAKPTPTAKPGGGGHGTPTPTATP